VKAELDGVITDSNGSALCAVEIETRVFKQMRGALLDLALHSAPKKLFVFMMAQPQLGTSEERALRHIETTWDLIGGSRGEFQAVVLSGTGEFPNEPVDKARIANALSKLGIEFAMSANV
jgi:hypothetical protein